MRASSFVAMVAAIAIIFSVITSPDREKALASTQLKATEMLSAPEQVELSEVLSQVKELQRLVELRKDFDTQLIETRLVAFKHELDEERTAEVAEVVAEPEEPEMQVAPVQAPAPAQMAPAQTVQSGGSSGSVQTTVMSYPVQRVVSSGGSSGGSSAYSSTVMQRVAAVQPVLTSARVAANTVQRVANYQPRWFNYDGRSKVQHASDYDHGFNPAGMSQGEIAMNLDAYHDTYGGSHSHTNTTPVYASSTSSNCPGGICPTSGTSSRSSYGPFGVVKWRNR